METLRVREQLSRDHRIEAPPLTALPPQRMRAVRLREHGSPQVLRIEEFAVPELRPGSVLIKVMAAGVNYADVQRRRGLYAENTPLPFPLGAEVSGTVCALGEGVTRVRVGQRVAALVWKGGYAEYCVAAAGNVFPLPASMSFEEGAAFLLNAIVAFHLLSTCGCLCPGQSVLVTAAAGGVGTLAVQLAKLFGAGLVIAAASTASKLRLARDLGADVGIDYTQAGWERLVREATRGRGVDVFLESAGGSIAVDGASTLAPFGRMVLYGAASGVRPPVSRDLLKLLNAAAIGFNLRTFLQADPARALGCIAELEKRLAARALRLIVGQRWPLDRVQEAHAALESRQTTGKVVLKVA